jgi:peptide/nickel transport system substrate-binding protein
LGELLVAKKIIILLIFSVAIIIYLSSQESRPNKEKERSYGDAIVIGEIFEPDIINPILTISGVSGGLVEIVFDGLVTRDEDMEIRPNLALSWDISNDGLRWRFYLKRGVRFHDGVELTAEDVKFTYEKIRDPDIKGRFFNIFKIIKDIRVIDRYMIEITLNKPFYPLLNYLDVGILPMHILLNEDIRKSDFNYHPIGTGPYKLTKWSKEEIVLDANEGYFKGRPYINRIIINIIRDQKSAWARLKKGELDLFSHIYPKDYEITKKIPSFNVYSFAKPYYYMLVFNLKNNLFKDLKVRQALNYAIDKDLIINEVFCKEGIISSGTISHYSWAYNPGIRPYPFDPQGL